jgi:hypothetical protein
MKILHLLASIDPRAGGPVEGVRRSGVAMQDAGHEIEVATCDAPGDAYLAAFPFPVHAFGPVNSRYSYSAQLAPWLVVNANRFEAACPTTCTCTACSTRGSSRLTRSSI